MTGCDTNAVFHHLHCPGCLQLFREAMLSQDFQEIHTPKLIAGASEGGAAVFRWARCGHDFYFLIC
jgi:aspartyl/asparaginyl-tRNA synthetase